MLALSLVVSVVIIPFSVFAESVEDYKSYFAQRGREEYAADCARKEQESYTYAYRSIANHARRYGARIVGSLTKDDNTECRGFNPYYATLDNQMRCFYTPFIPTAQHSAVTCK